MTKTFKEVIAGIRTAIYGREVREDIAQMGEYVEQFAKTATTKAAEALQSAADALASKAAAKTSEDNAAGSERAAAASAEAASASETAAKKSQSAAASSAAKAAASESAAKTSEANSKTSEENAKTSEDNAKASESAAAKSASAASASQTAAAGSASAAKTSKDAAAASSTAAQKSETSAADSAEAASNSQTHAENAAANAKESEKVAKEYLEQVKTITLGAQGWYETPEDLSKAVPIGEDGWWAVIGSTDTIWVWDKDTGEWKNSHQETELGDYYTRDQVNEKLDAKANKTADDLNTMINKLSAATSTPRDDDYYVCQFANGNGVDPVNVTYHRRPLKALWAYIKAKTDALYAAATHTHLYAGASTAGGSATSAAKLDTTTAGSATKPVYFKDGKPVAGTYELKKSVPADAVFTDTNTWRPIVNNLTSTATDQSLSAAQGKVLNDGLAKKAASYALATDANLNSATTPGIYNAAGGNSITNKPSGVDAFGLIVVHNANGSFYTQILTRHDSSVTYRRNCKSGTWNAWIQDEYTDTTYGAATSSALGLVKVGSNLTVSSGTLSLSKANVVAALGYTPQTSLGNWTLLESVTLSTSDTTFERTADSSGNAYALKAIKVFVTTGATQTKGTFKWTCSNKSSDGTYTALMSGTAPCSASSSTSKTYACFQAIPFAGHYICVSGAAVTGAEIPLTIAAGNSGQTVSTSKLIHKFTLVVNSNVRLYTGAVIKIYGIKA